MLRPLLGGKSLGIHPLEKLIFKKMIYVQDLILIEANAQGLDASPRILRTEWICVGGRAGIATSGNLRPAGYFFSQFPTKPPIYNERVHTAFKPDLYFSFIRVSLSSHRPILHMMQGFSLVR